MNPFRASRYMEHLRAEHAGSDAPIPVHVAAALGARRVFLTGPDAPRLLRQVAWLCALGVLDARIDCLLLPVYAQGSEIRGAGGLLARQQIAWPEVDWAERLGSGACLLLVDSADAGLVEAEADAWPACRMIAGADLAGAPAPHGFRTVFTDPLLQSSFTCP